MRALRLSILCITLAGCVSCGRKGPVVLSPIVVHVLRDPSAEFAVPLQAADSQFALGNPRLPDGRPVIIATNEGDSYAQLLRRVGEMPPTLLIADSDSTLPADVSSLVRPAAEASVCGAVPYEPSSVSGEEREAAELYLQFLETHCHGTVRVDWKAELAKAEAALQKKPRSAFWHNQAGIAYEALGDFTNAIKELKLARALDPTDPGNDYALWALYKRRGMHGAERQVLLDALEKDPNNPLGRFEFASILEQETDWADSLQEYQDAKHLLAGVSGSQYVDRRGGSYDVDGVRDEVDAAIDRVARRNDALARR